MLTVVQYGCEGFVILCAVPFSYSSWFILTCSYVFHCRLCFFAIDAIHNTKVFMTQINNTFKGGSLSCSLSDKLLTEYIQWLKRSCTGTLPVKKVCRVIGRQPNTDTWVFNGQCQIDGLGQMLTASQTPFFFLADMNIENRFLPSASLAPNVPRPLSTHTLGTLLKTLRASLKHNFIAAVLVMAGCLMSFHYQYILDKFEGCPVIVAYGNSGTGKTTSLKVGLALFGNCRRAIVRRATAAYIRDRCSLSTIPFGIDDPSVPREVGEMLVDLFNGATSATCSHSFNPVGIPVVTANFSMAERERLVACVNS